MQDIPLSGKLFPSKIFPLQHSFIVYARKLSSVDEALDADEILLCIQYHVVSGYHIHCFSLACMQGKAILPREELVDSVMTWCDILPETTLHQDERGR